MCGICGKIYTDSNQQVEPELVKKMADALVHRGPDAEGYYIQNHVGLGHRRLKIIDLEGGVQPMQNEDGSVVVSYNGEIYNFEELRRLLQKKGHQFRTRSDTEVIVHGYEEWGTGVLDYLRGMFAFAIWDHRLNRLFLARDRAGKKPLYYFGDGEKILFASELKAILTDSTVPRNLNLEAVDAYFSLGYIPSPVTVFQNIYKLEPGTFLIWQDGEIRHQRYWQVQFSGNGHYNEREAKERLQHLLYEATQIRLISDVPLGAFLSGGLDSSAVVALMSLIKKEPVLANSIGFEYEAYDETPFGRQVAKHCKAELFEYIVNPDLEEILPKLVYHFDEPFADSSALPTYYVSKMARQNVTVALSGDGGDENFAGYTRRYAFEKLENYWRDRLPDSVRKWVVRPIAKIYPKADWLPRPLRARTFLTNISSDPANAYFNSLSIMPTSIKRKLLKKEFSRHIKEDLALNLFKKLYMLSNTQDPVSRAQFIDIYTFLAEDVLVKVDRMSMANSLEVRSPLLDQKIVEFAASLPSQAKLHRGVSKYIFKKAMEDYLPSNIIYRKKHGFEIPAAEWFRKELRSFASDILFSRDTGSDIIDLNYLNKLWNAHLRRTANHAYSLWAVLMFKLWIPQYLPLSFSNLRVSSPASA